MAKEFEDDEERIEGLLAAAGLLFRRRFMESIKQIRDRFVLEDLIELLTARRYDEALVGLELAAANLAHGYTRSTILSGEDTMRFISRSINVVVSFNQTNTRAVDAMRRNELRLISEFSREQRLATRLAMLDGIARGMNPNQQAILFKQSIGLTRSQVQAVLNYRTLLEAGDSQALTRALRDRRFDRTVQGAIDGDRVLTPAQIDSMVERYQQRYLDYRSKVIARTEALRSVHEGANEAYRQAVDAKLIDSGELVQTWITARDERVRTSHSFMHRQQRPMGGEPFISGNGNRLKYPGDIDAPGSETIQCRCVLTTRFRIDAESNEAA
jgi:hypothetical protein